MAVKSSVSDNKKFKGMSESIKNRQVFRQPTKKVVKIMLKVAVVGVGGMGNVHVKAYRRMEDVKLVALCDVVEEKINDLCSEIGAAKYTDYKEMIEKEEIDILDIVTPSYIHKEIAIYAMDRKINVITEKPIALCEQDAKDVFECSYKNGVKFMVAHVLRFWPEYQALKKMVDEKTFGELIDARFFRIGRAPKWSWDNWMMDKERSGLVPFDLHIHDLDFIMYLMGGNMPDKINVNRVTNMETSTMDHVMATYVFGSKVINAEAAWFDSTYPFTAGYLVHFEDAVVEYNGKNVTVYPRNEEGYVLNMGNADAQSTGINLPDTDAYYNELRYFANKVKADEPVDCMKEAELTNVLNIIDKHF